MNNEYRDIRSRIAEPPKWFDEFAVPRYCAFAPRHAAAIYAREAVLVMIECQACRHQFHVCTTSMSGRFAEAIKNGSLHYGDPPNIECCYTGPSMNCVDVRVLEYWHRPDLDWVRDPSLEIALKRGRDDRLERVRRIPARRAGGGLYSSDCGAWRARDVFAEAAPRTGRNGSAVARRGF